MDDKKQKATVDKFISTINKDHSNNLLSYIQYLKEFILCVCKKYPMMIKNSSNFESIPVPKHWKITSFNHKMDLISSVAKYYAPFMKFYDNEDINNLLNHILEESQSLLLFMDSLPYFSSYTDENLEKHFHVIDEEMIMSIYNYLLMKSLTIYMDKIDDITSIHTGLSSVSEEQDMRVILARKKTVQQSVHDLLLMYITHFNGHYDISEPVYVEIKKRTLYAKEKEKIELVKYMSEMTDEQRNAEQALRATGQGRWATGQQKGYKEYQGSTYDEETREAREAAGVIDFTGEYMREEDLGEFDEEADALDMANLMEDDNNDEGGEYTIDPIDND